MNVAGGMLNDSKGYEYGVDGISAAIVFQLAIAAVYVILGSWDIPLRKTFRWPLFRLLFWILVAAASPGELGGFMLRTISSFCFFVNTVNQEFRLELHFGMAFFLGILLLGVTLYQVLVFELATWIQGRLFHLFKRK